MEAVIINAKHVKREWEMKINVTPVIVIQIDSMILLVKHVVVRMDIMILDR